jgi:hypothetical protein
MPNKALLMGINDYKDVSGLRGCVNDVNGFQELLLEMAYDSHNIHTLVDSEVIKHQILHELQWLFADVGQNDRLVFHFSGHGSYLPDTSGDEDIDELLCLYDMAGGVPHEKWTGR